MEFLPIPKRIEYGRTAMNPTRSRRPSRLKATIFALSLAAMTSQVGGAAAAPGGSGALAAVHMSASLPVAGERELFAGLASPVRHAPGSESWALLLAGLAGAWAI